MDYRLYIAIIQIVLWALHLISGNDIILIPMIIIFIIQLSTDRKRKKEEWHER